MRPELRASCQGHSGPLLPDEGEAVNAAWAQEEAREVLVTRSVGSLVHFSPGCASVTLYIHDAL